MPVTSATAFSLVGEQGSRNGHVNKLDDVLVEYRAVPHREGEETVMSLNVIRGSYQAQRAI
ncbi:uncharacterized protein EAE97_005504 [Botrytis byssoidea]|uniref:Uncharacterized protein n=1 Tax=Botrytis byssoidea TaxID=139641 RepID=A0A9P5IQA5_9HELO|nr:uncharacterized protein EAE97_005504 [Botrytis byssoidea]KAF7944871.1 hypothetical protein EAE97_005504 [Botrytis byssoidea]